MNPFRFKIGNKLALLLIGFSVVVMALMSSLFIFQFEEALKERVFLQLSSVKQLKISRIENELLKESDALRDFMQKRDSLELNPDFFHAIYNIREDTIIGDYPIDIPEGLENGEVQIQDLTVFAGGITLAFVAGTGNAYLVAIATPDIQSIVLERSGLGETGESYLVGEDFKMRTSSRFFPDKTPMEITVNNSAMTEALAGRPGSGVIKDYRDIEVFSSYEKVEINGLTWVLLSEIDKQEAFFPLKKLKVNLIIMLSVIVLFVIVASHLLSKQIVKPLLIMEEKLRGMSRGMIDQAPIEVSRKDEIGQMFTALSKLVKGLIQTVDFADKIGGGDFEADYKKLSEDDKLGGALLQMKQRLKNFKENESRLIKENQKSLLAGEEKERSRFSKELHDGLGPLLTSLRIHVQSLDLADEKKLSLYGLIDETIREVRRMSNNLMPSVLEDFGAGEAIRNLTKRMQSDSLCIKYNYEAIGSLEVPKSVNIAIYRIAQESINNVVKHSGATELRVSVTEFEDKISLFISDNGTGFDSSQLFLGNGLVNIRERVKLENGILDIHSDESGTNIEVEIPL